MSDTAIFLTKALECLQCAESELAAKRLNNVANRAYYAAFQAAVAAMIAAGIRPQQEGGGLSHRHVQSAFSGLLVYRRKLYDTRYRNILQALMSERAKADYTTRFVSEPAARRAVKQAADLITAVQTRIAPPKE